MEKCNLAKIKHFVGNEKNLPVDNYVEKFDLYTCLSILFYTNADFIFVFIYHNQFNSAKLGINWIKYSALIMENRAGIEDAINFS